MSRASKIQDVLAINIPVRHCTILCVKRLLKSNLAQTIGSISAQKDSSWKKKSRKIMVLTYPTYHWDFLNSQWLFVNFIVMI